MKHTTKLLSQAAYCLLVSLGIGAYAFISPVPEFMFVAAWVWFFAALLMFGLYKQAKALEGEV